MVASHSWYEYSVLFLLCLISFVIGWFWGRKSTREKKTDEKPVTAETVTIVSPVKTLRAVQTRDRKGVLIIPPASMTVQEGRSGYEKLDFSSEKDDLKRIKGIGAILEARLWQEGVYTFMQISQFTEKDVKNIAEAIGYHPERILREGWIEQAKTLLHHP
jgi:predicted flap endonuclease-1-like 5' DNA nuclease